MSTDQKPAQISYSVPQKWLTAGLIYNDFVYIERSFSQLSVMDDWVISQAHYYTGLKKRVYIAYWLQENGS